MLSTSAVLDIKVNAAHIRSFDQNIRGDQKSAVRYLSALKLECEQRRIAWQVYRAVKRDAKRIGLIPQ